MEKIDFDNFVNNRVLEKFSSFTFIHFVDIPGIILCTLGIFKILQNKVIQQQEGCFYHFKRKSSSKK